MTLPPDSGTPDPGTPDAGSPDPGAAPSGRFVAAADPIAPEPPKPDQGGDSGWAGRVALAGLGLALIELAQVVGSLVEGLAVPAGGPQGLAGDVWQRVGYAFLTNVTVANGVLLVVAILMVSAPVALGRGGSRLVGELAAAVVSITAAALAIGSVLAVRTRLHQFALLHQGVPAYQRRALFSFVVGSVGTCLVAFGLALTAPRRR